MAKERHKWKDIQRTLTHGYSECIKCGMVKKVLWSHPYTTEYVDTTTGEITLNQNGCNPAPYKQLKLL